MAQVALAQTAQNLPADSTGIAPAASVVGEIDEESGEAVAFANVALLNAADSSLVTGTVSDSVGLFTLGHPPQGDYLVKISFLGYQTLFTHSFQAGGNAPTPYLGVLILKPDAGLLQPVTVTGEKPLIEHKLDRTVLNVENNILSQGDTASAVLEKAPGVMVN